jgi:LCP family protein required for cell wall assembly
MHKKEQRYRHRWRRRSVFVLAGIVLLALLGAGGLYAYITYRYDQIKKIHSKHLVAEAGGGQPFNVLLVGSDTRAFVQNATQANAFGTQANAGGQRSDVTMVARFVPATKTVTILSIPRDLWVDIPGNQNGISGMNRINVAYNSGPDLLIQTIENNLHIPINHYMSVDFPGFSDMVNAVGGITMDFPTEVKDQDSGLNVTTPGCQAVNGTTALELVRARHLYYMQNGSWQYDGQSDFSRIQRQDAFFRALLDKLDTLSLNPLTINSFIGAAVGNLTIDDALSKRELFDIANQFRGLPSSHFVTETLPTVGYTTAGGAQVLAMAQPYALDTVVTFNHLGQAPPRPGPLPPRGSKKKVRPETHGAVNVQVLNGSTATGLAHATALALAQQGFAVGTIGNAPTPIPGGSPSQIHYGPSGYRAAFTLASVLGGPFTYVPDNGLTGQDVSLVLAGPQLTVTGPTGAPHVPVTTVPTTTTTTTIPPDVVTNAQPESWNPYPCTPGSTQTTPRSTPTTHKTSTPTTHKTSTPTTQKTSTSTTHQKK